MYYADTVGLPTVLARVEDYRRQFGDYWKPAPLLARLASEGRGFHDSDTPAPPSRGTP
jgi:3-hydroxyacyl-CoA dehydrogenase